VTELLTASPGQGPKSVLFRPVFSKPVDFGFFGKQAFVIVFAGLFGSATGSISHPTLGSRNDLSSKRPSCARLPDKTHRTAAVARSTIVLARSRAPCRVLAQRGQSQLSVGDPVEVETDKGRPGIDWRSPDRAPVGLGLGPEMIECGNAAYVGGQGRFEEDARQTVARDPFADCLKLRQPNARRSVETGQVAVLMQMLDVTADFVKLAHEIMMLGADEKLGPPLELNLRALVVRFPTHVNLSDLERSNQALDAAGELMDAVENIKIAAGLLVDIDAPDKAPTVSFPNTAEGTQALCKSARPFEAFFVDRLVIRYE
jgi:hypothetical protein